MTATVPVVVTTVEPTKAKSWVALVGSLLTFIIPLLTSVQGYLPPPWPAVIGAILAIGTFVGVRQTPNTPKDTSVVPNNQIISLPPTMGYTPTPDVPVGPGTRIDGVPTGPPVSAAPSGQYRNPWE